MSRKEKRDKQKTCSPHIGNWLKKFKNEIVKVTKERLDDDEEDIYREELKDPQVKEMQKEILSFHLEEMTPFYAAALASRLVLIKGYRKKSMTPLKWFMTSNPLLGNVSPIDMIHLGRGDKLCKWVKNQIEENTL